MTVIDMMEKDPVLEVLLQDAVWAAKALFDRGRATGSSANLSFIHGDSIYITASGGCFGRLTSADFARVDRESLAHLSGPRPSKELPLHATLYRANPEARAVVHSHSHYTTLWACLEHPAAEDVMPAHTPYLKMKLAQIDLIPFAPPGSRELFALLEARVRPGRGYLLQNHGGLVAGKDILDAFSIYEELEDSAWIAWDLRQAGR